MYRNCYRIKLIVALNSELLSAVYMYSWPSALANWWVILCIAQRRSLTAHCSDGLIFQQQQQTVRSAAGPGLNRVMDTKSNMHGDWQQRLSFSRLPLLSPSIKVNQIYSHTPLQLGSLERLLGWEHCIPNALCKYPISA